MNASFRVIFAMAVSLCRDDPQAVALHLDHCHSLDCIRQALEAGFTSVMYDGSALPFSENVRRTQEARRMADCFGAALEGELGGLNDEFGGSAGTVLTNPDQAALYVAETQVDSLAVSVGNVHGLYSGEPYIDLSRLAAIAKKVDVPLVLHGSSGIPKEVLRQAGRIAVAKINVNTEITMAGASALKKALETETRMEKPMISAREAMVYAMKHFYA